MSNKKIFIITVIILTFTTIFQASAFIGPSAGQTPGSGGGALLLDSERNLGFGTTSSTPRSFFDAAATDSGPTTHGYVFMVASTTNPGVGLKNLTSGNVWLWSSRNFGPLQLYRESETLPGLVVMEILPTGEVGIHTRATSTARLKVGGNVESTGSFVGTLSGALSAANVSSDVFGRLQGNGNFAFPASLGIATSSQSGLPQTLSVFGGGYFSGNVGIGTAGPEGKLSVTGDVGIGAIANTDQASHMLDIASTKGSAGNSAIRALYPAGGGLAGTEFGALAHRDGEWKAVYAKAGTGGAIALYTDGEVNLMNGNVGIGTTGPSGKLHVAGTGTQDAKIFLTSSAVDSWPEIRFQNDAATWRLFAPDGSQNDIFLIDAPGTVAPNDFVISTAGNVGIGTTGPWKNLHILGDSSGAELRIEGSVNTQEISMSFRPAGNLSSTNLQWQLGRAFNANRFEIRSYDGTTDSTRLAIDSAGNVGIGTTNPTYKLSVAGEIDVNSYRIVNLATPSNLTDAATKSYVDSVVGGGGGAGSFATLTVSGTSTLATTQGRVGIGTTTPSSKLEIRGSDALGSSLRLSRSATAYWDIYPVYFQTNPDLFFVPNGGATPTLTLAADGDVGIGYNNPGTAKLAINGNVGIGTTAPAYKLDVVGTARFSQPIFVGSPGDPSHAATKSYVDSAVGGGGGAGSFATLTVSGTSTLATTQGRVGIGTTGPGNLLEVNTDIAGEGYSLYDSVSARQIAKLYRGSSSNDPGVLDLYNAGSVTVSINGEANVNSYFNTGGNVGIGTTAPAYKLDVVGTARFSQPIFVGSPGDPSHAATKSYVDSSIASGTSSNAFACSADETCDMNGANLNNGNIVGVNKLTVTTIDPLYEINGVKYATYVSDTIGLKIEHYGKVKLVRNGKSGLYEQTIDFKKAEEGSDLWLFWQTIDEGRNMEDVIVTLTPEFDGRVWYELRPKQKQIAIYGSSTSLGSRISQKTLTVSYHIVAPRHDASNWPTKTDTSERATVLRAKN